MAHIVFELSSIEAKTRLQEIVAKELEERKGCADATLRIFRDKALELEVHKLDFEAIVNKELNRLNRQATGESFGISCPRCDAVFPIIVHDCTTCGWRFSIYLDDVPDEDQAQMRTSIVRNVRAAPGEIEEEVEERIVREEEQKLTEHEQTNKDFFERIERKRCEAEEQAGQGCQELTTRDNKFGDTNSTNNAKKIPKSLVIIGILLILAVLLVGTYKVYNEFFLVPKMATMAKQGDEFINNNDDTIQVKGVDLLQKASGFGNIKAMNSLGNAYAYGRGITQDQTEAVKWYRKAAELGNASAMCNLGFAYDYGRGVPVNQAEGVKWYLKAIELGDASAMGHLGYAYDYGRGVTQDQAEGVKWYRKAAELGNASAMCNLGFAYDYGRGVTQDKSEGVIWYRKAIELGDAPAMCNLGFAYDYGRGVTQDQAEGVRWYRKAAELGNASAICNLGSAYYFGRGVTQDQAEGVKWYRKAAELRNAVAMDYLGNAYTYGRGVIQDQAEAVKWYRQAAELWRLQR